MSCPNPFTWMTQPPYEGGTVTYVDTINGYDMYYASGPGGIYCAVNPVNCSELTAMGSTRASYEAYLMSLPYPGEPTPYEPYVVDVYRSIEIYHDEMNHNYFFDFAGVRYGFSDTTSLEDIRFAIDDKFQPLDPNTSMLVITLGLMATMGAIVLSGRK